MEGIKIRKNTLFSLFLKQVIGIGVATLAEIVLFISLFYAGLYSGVILPANFVENYLIQIEKELTESEPFDERMLPAVCQYALFDLQGEFVEGNAKTPSDLKQYMNKEVVRSGYRTIQREDGYCVIKYSVEAHFSNPVLHKLIPHLELTLFCVFILVFILTVTIAALRFGKKLKSKLSSLLTEIGQIKERELSFSEQHSDIQEFDDVLNALHDMKSALADSLKKEWATEKRRKENISALAHDIKTPLTIIKGNAELLKEETELAKIYQHADIIDENTDKIQCYIGLLIDETKGIDSENSELCKLEELIDVIKKQSKELCEIAQIRIEIEETWMDHKEKMCRMRFTTADRIERAVFNLVDNAITYTEKDKGIKLSFLVKESQLVVKVEDYGNGFSKEALLHATEQFYTQNKGRSDAHYGLGLYFANSVAKENGGTLTIQNKKNENGSVVTIRFETFGE